MGDRRRDDAMRQQPPFSSGHQDRVFDGGGQAPYGSDYDPASSYMSLLGTGINQQPPPWSVEEVTAATPINLTPQFSMVIYFTPGLHRSALPLVLGFRSLQVNEMEMQALWLIHPTSSF